MQGGAGPRLLAADARDALAERRACCGGAEGLRGGGGGRFVAAGAWQHPKGPVVVAGHGRGVHFFVFAPTKCWLRSAALFLLSFLPLPGSSNLEKLTLARLPPPFYLLGRLPPQWVEWGGRVAQQGASRRV